MQQRKVESKFINKPVRKNHVSSIEQENELTRALETEQLIEIVGPIHVGKSAFLQEFLLKNQFKLHHEYVIWIDCQDSAISLNDLIKIAQELNFTSSDGKSVVDEITIKEYLIKFCQKNRCIVVLNKLNERKLFEQFLPILQNSVLIYTSTKEFEKKDIKFKRITISPLNAEKNSELAQLYLDPKKDKVNEASQIKLQQITGGLPPITIAICKIYQGQLQFKNFQEFLDSIEPENLNASQDLFGSIIDSIKQFIDKKIKELQLKLNSEEALIIQEMIQRIALIAPEHPMPVDFFFTKDSKILNLLNNDFVHSIINYDREKQELSIYKPIQMAILAIFNDQEMDILKKNINKLNELFQFNTDQSHLADIDQINKYITHVENTLAIFINKHNYFLMNTGISNVTSSSKEKDVSTADLAIISSVSELLASIGRFYYRRKSDFKLALLWLQKGRLFLEKVLNHNDILAFRKRKFNDLSSNIDSTVQDLLKIYAKEFLHQHGTISSRLSDGHTADQNHRIIKDLRHAYYILRNLFSKNNDKSILVPMAFAARNLSRALRKQGQKGSALRYFQIVKDLIQEYSDTFVGTQSQLLFDEGIILKEIEDQKLENERQYSAAIKKLKKTYENLTIKTTKTLDDNQNIALILMYLGDAYIAKGIMIYGLHQYFSSLKHLEQPDSKEDAKWVDISKLYYKLADVFAKMNLFALAKIYSDKALPIYLDIYGIEHLYYVLLLNLHTQIEVRFAADRENKQNHLAQRDILAFASKIPMKVDTHNYLHKQFIGSGLINPDNDELNQWNKYLLTIAYDAIDQSDKEKELENRKMKDERIAEMKLKQDDVTNMEREQNDRWYVEIDQVIKIEQSERLKLFASEFSKYLAKSITKNIAIKYNINMDPSKVDIFAGLVNALAYMVPSFKGLSVEGQKITANIENDMPAVIHKMVETLDTFYKQSIKAEAGQKLAFIESKVPLIEHAKSIIDEMASYAARCYQPLFDKLDEQYYRDDIKILAKYGAERVIEYQLRRETNLTKSSYPLREMVIAALSSGTVSKKLKTKKIILTNEHNKSKRWRVNGFFSKSGIQDIDSSQPHIFVPLDKLKSCKLNLYGCRFGSIFEIQESNCKEFNDEHEAIKIIESSNKHRSLFGLKFL